MTKTCPECGGVGECEYEEARPDPMAWRGGELVGVIRECHVCEGVGEVDDDEDDFEGSMVGDAPDVPSLYQLKAVLDSK